MGSSPKGPDAPRPFITGPFVPRNLISTQGSTVPSLKFQMAPRLYVTVMLTVTATCHQFKVNLCMVCCFLTIFQELKKRSSTKAK